MRAMPTVLVVDDELKIARLIRDYLEQAGFVVATASDGRGAIASARQLKPDLIVPDEDVTVDMIKRALVIAGSPRRVLEQLVALREETGHFGTLLMGGHDWDRPEMWRRSMELLATQVMPKFSQHAETPRA